MSFRSVSHILELVNNTIPEDSNHLKMFLFLKKILFKMNDGIDPEIISFIFELKLLYFLGYGLNFKQCNVCQTNDDLVFSVEHGGLVCKKHLLERQSSYDKDIYQIIMYLYAIDLDKAEVPNIDKNIKVIIRHIIDMLFNDYLGFKTKSRSIIEQLQKY